MKNRILPIVFFLTAIMGAAAQNAQETFDADLEKLNNKLQKYEFIEKKTENDSTAVVQKLITCDDLKQTVEAADLLLKQKVGIRADNKKKINEVLFTLVDSSQILCKEEKGNSCCQESLKLLAEFCKVNELLQFVFPKEEKENNSPH